MNKNISEINDVEPGPVVELFLEDIQIGQDGLLLHHTFFGQPWQQGLVMHGENGLHALTADGDKFVGAPVATVVPRSE